MFSRNVSESRCYGRVVFVDYAGVFVLQVGPLNVRKPDYAFLYKG